METQFLNRSYVKKHVSYPSFQAICFQSIDNVSNVLLLFWNLYFNFQSQFSVSIFLFSIGFLRFQSTTFGFFCFQCMFPNYILSLTSVVKIDLVIIFFSKVTLEDQKAMPNQLICIRVNPKGRKNRLYQPSWIILQRLSQPVQIKLNCIIS